MQIIDTLPIITKFQIEDEQKNLIPFNLWERQLDAYNLLHTWRYLIFLKSRQSGFSTLTGADSIALCAAIKRMTILVLSVTGNDAEEYLYRTMSMWRTDDPVINAIRETSPTIKDTMSEVWFENGSRLISLPASKGFGYSADRVVIDEFYKINKKRSHIEMPAVLSHIIPALDKRKGQLVLQGTAEGSNVQSEMYWDAKRGKTSFKSLFFSCWDDPTMTPEKRDQKIIDLGKEGPGIINQEYPRTDNEAFLASGRRIGFVWKQ